MFCDVICRLRSQSAQIRHLCRLVAVSDRKVKNTSLFALSVERRASRVYASQMRNSYYHAVKFPCSEKMYTVWCGLTCKRFLRKKQRP